jgi:hypothetical protein
MATTLRKSIGGRDWLLISSGNKAIGVPLDAITNISGTSGEDPRTVIQTGTGPVIGIEIDSEDLIQFLVQSEPD